MTRNLDPFNPAAHIEQALLDREHLEPGQHVLAAIVEQMASQGGSDKVGWSNAVSGSRARRVGWSLGLLSLVFLGSDLRLLLSRPGLGLAAAVGYGVVAAGFLFFFGIGGRATVSPVTRRVLAYLVPTSCLSLLGTTAHYFATGAEFVRADRLHATESCLVHSLAAGVIASAALFAMFRKTDPFSPAVTGALLGSVGALVGTLSVELICDNAEGFHNLIGHGLVVLVVAGIGAVGGRKWLSPA